MQNEGKPNERRRISVLKTFKIEIQNKETINSAVLQNWFSPRN